MGNLASVFVEEPTWIIVVDLIATLLLIAYLGIFWGALLGIQKQNGVPGFNQSFATFMLWLNIFVEIFIIIAFFFMIWGLATHLSRSSKKKTHKRTISIYPQISD